MDIFVLTPLVVGKISLYSGMSNDALMHREGLEGYTTTLYHIVLAYDNILKIITHTYAVISPSG